MAVELKFWGDDKNVDKVNRYQVKVATMAIAPWSVANDKVSRTRRPRDPHPYPVERADSLIRMAFRFASLAAAVAAMRRSSRPGRRGVGGLWFRGTRVRGRPLRRLAFDPTGLAAILVTHEHGDHMRGVGAVARRFGIPVWMTTVPGVRRISDPISSLNLFASHAVGSGSASWPSRRSRCRTMPASRPSSFRPCRPASGTVDRPRQHHPRVVEAFDGVDALLLECNHDLECWRNGPYPPSLQARVGGLTVILNNPRRRISCAASTTAACVIWWRRT